MSKSELYNVEMCAHVFLSFTNCGTSILSFVSLFSLGCAFKIACLWEIKLNRKRISERTNSIIDKSIVKKSSFTKMKQTHRKLIEPQLNMNYTHAQINSGSSHILPLPPLLLSCLLYMQCMSKYFNHSKPPSERRSKTKRSKKHMRYSECIATPTKLQQNRYIRFEKRVSAVFVWSGNNNNSNNRSMKCFLVCASFYL